MFLKFKRRRSLKRCVVKYMEIIRIIKNYSMIYSENGLKYLAKKNRTNFRIKYATISILNVLIVELKKNVIHL